MPVATQRKEFRKKYHIALTISEAIRQGKWLDVQYCNNKNQNRQFLFAVKDIDWNQYKLMGDLFNPMLEQELYPFLANKFIDFTRLKYARVMPDISYEVPESLLKKLERAEETEDFLQFNEQHHSLLAFLEQCIQFDIDPTVKKITMIEGLDANTLVAKEKTPLTKEQCKKLAIDLRNWQEEERRCNRIVRLALNILSIKRYGKNIPIIYKEVLLHINEDEQFLVVGKGLQFSKSYLLGKGSDSFFLRGFDYNPEEFLAMYESNRDSYIEEIRKNLCSAEIINTNPEFMQLSGNFNVRFNRVKNSVINMIKNKTLTVPLKAFLGMNAVQQGRKRNATVVTYDNKVNIDQVHVVFNALRENITYVEGPPGTGKTQTILNVIFSLFFDGRNCLVCSNNNAPIEGIIEKLVNDLPKCNNQEILFPILRIGSSTKTLERENILQETISRAKYLYENAIKKSKPYDSKTTEQNELVRKNTKALSDSLSLYEQKQQLSKRKETLENWKQYIDSSNKFFTVLHNEIKKVENEIAALPNLTNEDIQKLCIAGLEDKNFINFLYYHSIKLLQKLQGDEYKPFIEILYEENKQKAVQDFKKYLSNDKNISLLIKVFPVWFSTNISSEKIGSAIPHFDMCIMDESGQCDIARSLIPIIRAERLLLVGDTNQLKPVVLLDEKKQKIFQKALHIKNPHIYDYVHGSILSLMQQSDSISKKILLRYHYRCAPEIIQFSNSYYYDNRLHIENKLHGNVSLFDVVNHQGDKKNSYEEECSTIIHVLKNDEYKNKKIAIITPFVNQANLINKKLQEEKMTNVFASTIHKVQGSEYDVIFLSFALAQTTSSKTFDWVKDNKEITNVAVTRAKKELLICADKNAIHLLSKNTENAVKELITYAESVQYNKSYTVASPKQKPNLSNNSEYEKQFFKTLSQVLSVVGGFRVERNVPMKKVFPSHETMFKSYYEKSEFDVVLWRLGDNYKRPLLVIELDGEEHYVSSATRERDNKKELLCKEQGIHLFRLPNSFASHYMFVKEYIANMSENSLQGQLL